MSATTTNVILCDIYKNTTSILKDNIREINTRCLGVLPKEDELDELDSILDIMINNRGNTNGTSKYTIAEKFINKYN